MQKEVYPALLLFPAENKTAITFEGYMSVANIIDFLLSHGRNSQYLTRRKGIQLLSWSFLNRKSVRRSNTLIFVLFRSDWIPP